MRFTLSALVAASLLWAAPALAQEDDSSEEASTEEGATEDEVDLFADEDADDDEDNVDLNETEEQRKAREAAEAARRLQEADDVGAEDEGIENLDDATIEDDGTDLLGETIDKDQIGGEGQDNAKIYRRFQEKVEDYVIDEELVAWEGYLEDYPNTLFRDRIEKRMDELEARMYEERLDLDGPDRVDADKRDFAFSQALLLSSLNPRTRLQAGFEWGLPNYMNLFVDYEHQLQNDLAFHVGAGRRFTGWSLEGGVHWAFIKSARTKTIVALLGDVRLNTNPAFLGLRPQLAIGKKFGNLDLQAQGGVEIDSRGNAPMKGIGGANLSYRANDNISAFLETSLYMKSVNWQDGGSFRFNLATFGLKFYPLVGDLDLGQVEVNVGASVPYTANYWMYHYGSIMAQVNYYM